MFAQFLGDVILQVGGHEELKALIIDGLVEHILLLLRVVLGEDTISVKFFQDIFKLLGGILTVLL